MRSNITEDEREEIINAHVDKLRAVERVIALGLLDPSVQPGFAKVVHDMTDSVSSSYEGADWMASLQQINRRYNAAGGNMAAEMEQSLLAHGGTSADAELLKESIWGVNLSGLVITTNIRLSYKDGKRPSSDVHAISTSQLNPIMAAPVWVYNGSGFEETTKNLEELDGVKTWNVNLLLTDINQVSKILYTSPVPDGPSEICLFCRCHWSTHIIGCMTYAMGRRCSCRAHDVPAPHAQAQQDTGILCTL